MVFIGFASSVFMFGFHGFYHGLPNKYYQIKHGDYIVKGKGKVKTFKAFHQGKSEGVGYFAPTSMGKIYERQGFFWRGLPLTYPAPNEFSLLSFWLIF